MSDHSPGRTPPEAAEVLGALVLAPGAAGILVPVALGAGATTYEIGAALGKDPSTIRRQYGSTGRTGAP
jgi:hypothetical protein